MKKFIAGVIVGGFLFAGASVFADSSSLIGQKVQGLFSIEKAGTKVADAVVINGTAYAPVRAVSDATGAGLTVDGKRIIIQEKEETLVSSVPTIQEKLKQSQIDSLNKVIEQMNADIKKYNSFLSEEKIKLQEASSVEARKNIQDNIDMLQVNIKTSQDSLESAQAKLAELQN
ncbi:Atg14 domain-containing protein [Paenibacillus sonchi]|uniref:Atg14 domain-containing protein n=1 Tax=Paenibacillus sonchi TaxID=373687 RepID=UPI001E44EF38|nr:Atg14 domain-containing protein [Paenibacillus sonchi]MCE3202468.1 hypothetical protein [Paenibacillus sonchi]